MIALSGRQPWWWAILHAGKRIENRRWNTRYRGPIMLHAAKGCTVDEYEDAWNWMLSALGREHEAVQRMPELSAMQRGGIVGLARIVDVIPPGGAQTRFVRDDHPGLDVRWHMSDQFGFVLADVEPLPFVPWKGALGLFKVPDDYATTGLEATR